MPSLTYIPSCHVTNMSDYATQSRRQITFKVSDCLPDMSYRENTYETLDGTPCITGMGKSISYSFTVPVIEPCDMPEWVEMISSVKCNGGLEINLCDVASVAQMHSTGGATIVGNPSWSEVGAHNHSLKLKVKMKRWGCF